MDFIAATAIGSRINADDEQIHYAQGYDHTWVLDKESEDLGIAARLHEPTTGRVMLASAAGRLIDVACPRRLMRSADTIAVLIR